MLFFSAALMAIAGASHHMNTNVVTAIINTISAVIPFAIVLSMATKKSVQTNKWGVILAIAGGVFIALYGLSITKSFSINKVGIVTPIIYGGTIFLTTILSYFVFKEKISVLQGIGLFILLIGFAVITYARVTGK